MIVRRCLQSFIILMISSMIFLMLATIQPATAESDSPWPMWRHDSAHTGVADGSSPTNLAIKWKFNTDGPVTSSPSIVGGKVYIGSLDRNLYCVDSQGGSLIWKYKMNASILSSPSIVDGRVYVGPDDGNIYCLNANNGSLIWKTYAGGRISMDSSLWQMIRSSPVVIGKSLYVGALDNKVYCLNADSGAVVWTYETGGSIFSSPANVGGIVYVGSADRYLYALNATNGTLIWKFDGGYMDDYGSYPRHGIFSSPTVAEDLSMIYVFSNVLAYYAVDAKTGTLQWQYLVPRNGTFAFTQWVTPTYFAGKLYFQDDFLEVCVDAKTGKGPLWIANVGYFGRSSAAYAEGKVFTSGNGYHGVFALDASTGNTLSFAATQGATRSSPSVAYDCVYVGSYQDSGLYCFTEGVPQSPKTKTSITYKLSATELMVGEPVTLEGAVSPTPSSLPPIIAFFKRPDGTSVQITATANSDGSFEMFYKPDVEGNWTARAFWGGDEINEGASASELSFVVEASPPTPPTQQTPPPPASIPNELYVALALISVILNSELIYLYFRRKRAAKG